MSLVWGFGLSDAAKGTQPGSHRCHFQVPAAVVVGAAGEAENVPPGEAVEAPKVKEADADTRESMEVGGELLGEEGARDLQTPRRWTLAEGWPP